MRTCKGFRRFICAAVLASAALYGCGGSETSESIPSSATIFYSHSVIVENQDTYTMGYNAFGQLGDGTLTTRATAAKVPGLGPMVKGVAGAEHTLVFGNSTTASAWGYNLYGQLGNETVSTTWPEANSMTPVKVYLGAIVSDIAAGAYHSLAIAGEKVKAWGYNGYGQLGNDSTVNANKPVSIEKDVDGNTLPAMAQVAAGGRHSLALAKDGSAVYAWGNNASGQLGFTNISSTAPVLTITAAKPKKVVFANAAPTGKIEQIAALGRSSIALEVVRDPLDSTIITSQKLWGWGYNGNGELGFKAASKDFVSEPTTVLEISNVTADTVITKIVAGTNHILLLLGNGTVKAIGYNYYGQLGNNKGITGTGNDTSVSSFEFVNTLNSSGTGNLTGVTDIAAFGYHSLARVGGVWYGWGNNSQGQLGNPIVTDAVGYFQLPVTVKGF